ELWLAVEHGADAGRHPGKATTRLEGDRVATAVELDPGALDVPGEDAERAAVLDAGDQHALVRHQQLGARRELVEEAMGIERPFQGARERRHAGQQVVEHWKAL